MARTIEAERIILKDENGETRAVFGLAEDGARQTVLIRETGHTRVALMINDEDEPTMVLTGNAGERRLELTVSHNGIPSVDLSDDAGNLRGTFHVANDGTPKFALIDRRGSLRAITRLFEDGSPVIQLLGDQQKSLFRAPEKKKRHSMNEGGDTRVSANRNGNMRKIFGSLSSLLTHPVPVRAGRNRIGLLAHGHPFPPVRWTGFESEENRFGSDRGEVW